MAAIAESISAMGEQIEDRGAFELRFGANPIEVRFAGRRLGAANRAPAGEPDATSDTLFAVIGDETLEGAEGREALTIAGDRDKVVLAARSWRPREAPDSRSSSPARRSLVMQHTKYRLVHIRDDQEG